jgi:hypothetical protein
LRLRFEIYAIEGGVDCSERQCEIAVEEDAENREESEISSPETGERFEQIISCGNGTLRDIGDM